MAQRTQGKTVAGIETEFLVSVVVLRACVPEVLRHEGVNFVT